MKKFIAMITCLILFIGTLVLPVPVSAAEDSEYNSYYIQCLNSDMEHGSQENIYIGNLYESRFSINKKLAGVFCKTDRGCEIKIYLFDSSQIYLNGVYNNLACVSEYADSKDISGYYKYGNYSIEDGNAVWSYVTQEGDLSDSYGALFSWVTEDINDSGYLHTNIPYFVSEEECLSYINGTLSIKNAMNYESDISNIKYDLEIPKNLKITDVQNTGENGYFQFTWEQTDPNYKNWKTEIYEYTDFRYRNSILIFSWEDWKYVEDFYVGQSIIDTYKLSYKIGHMKYADDDALNDKISSLYPTEYGGIYEFCDSKIYIRNSYFDGEIRHYSNWVIIEFDPEDGAIVNPGLDSTVVEQEGSEIEIDDNGYVKQPDSDIIEDSEYTGVVNDNLESVNGTDIISWISNGFGLGGESGVLAMLSETFSFIPSEIWSVFIAGISIMVVVAIFKFIRG